MKIDNEFGACAMSCDDVAILPALIYQRLPHAPNDESDVCDCHLLMIQWGSFAVGLEFRQTEIV